MSFSSYYILAARGHFRYKMATEKRTALEVEKPTEVYKSGPHWYLNGLRLAPSMHMSSPSSVPHRLILVVNKHGNGGNARVDNLSEAVVKC